MDQTLDVRTLIETIRFVKIFRETLLQKNQRILAQFTKDHYLEKSSEASDEEQDHEEKIGGLVGYTISNNLDRSLLKRIVGSMKKIKVDPLVLSNEANSVVPILETIAPEVYTKNKQRMRKRELQFDVD